MNALERLAEIEASAKHYADAKKAFAAIGAATTPAEVEAAGRAFDAIKEPAHWRAELARTRLPSPRPTSIDLEKEEARRHAPLQRVADVIPIRRPATRRETRPAPARASPSSLEDDPPPMAITRRHLLPVVAHIAGRVRLAEQAGAWEAVVALAGAAQSLACAMHGLPTRGRA